MENPLLECCLPPTEDLKYDYMPVCFHLKALYTFWIMHDFNLIAVSLKGKLCVYTVYTVYGVKCANYLVICNLVLEHYFLPSQTECVNGIKYLYRGQHLSAALWAVWFHTANATVTNDSGCDPMTRTLSSTNKRPDEWASVAAVSPQQ